MRFRFFNLELVSRTGLGRHLDFLGKKNLDEIILRVVIWNEFPSLETLKWTGILSRSFIKSGFH